MEETDFSIFRKFTNLDHAHDIHDLLTANGIETIIADNSSSLDNSFGGNHAQDELEIRIHVSNFEKAEDLLAEHARASLNDVPKDYYLFSFTDDELYEVLVKSDEWNEFDYLLAQKILQDRDKPVNDELLDTMKRKRLEELAKPDKGQTSWIVAGYIFAFLGGFFGILIGYFLWSQKKTLPNGVKVYSHSEGDRKQGKRILIIGIVMFVVGLMVQAVDVF